MLKKVICLTLILILSLQEECEDEDTRCKECKTDKSSCVSCKETTDWIYKDKCFECSKNYMCEVCDTNSGCKKCQLGFEIYQKEGKNFCKKKAQNCDSGNDRCQYCEVKTKCSICKDPTDFINDKGKCSICKEIKNCKECNKTGCSVCKGEFKKKENNGVFLCVGEGSQVETKGGMSIFTVVGIGVGVFLILCLFLLYWFKWRIKWRREKLQKKSAQYNSALIQEEDDDMTL